MFLQSLVFGYGGVRFNDQGISLDPLLPPGVTAMKLRGLSYAGGEFDVEIDGGGSHFVRRSSSVDNGEITLHRASEGVYWLTTRTHTPQ
jgi:trehalose/maltose hydrolase-like predicted phosphorylase